MILEKITTPGLAHYSYFLAAGGKSAVIDPRRDIEVYLRLARDHGCSSDYIFETHRNEDLISGACALAEQTGATVLHGPNAAAEVKYAKVTTEGDSYTLGALELKVLETPGHTDDHIAVAIYDQDYAEGAVAVFTGDALFVGDVGRTDFYPERREEVAGLLWDSLQKLMKLGDQAIVYPAHGAGSVCGSGMADREETTIGHERANNPRLQLPGRDEFIREKLGETHYYPPYFTNMEKLNLVGARMPENCPLPRPVSIAETEQLNIDKLVDVRGALAFAAAHLPGSLCIPITMLSAFAGWFLESKDRLLIVADSSAQWQEAVTQLQRIGFDQIVGALLNPVQQIAQGNKFRSIPLQDSSAVRQRLADADKPGLLLDVRAQDEVESLAIKQARHIYIGQLQEHWKNLETDTPVTVMCGSGMRATIAASWLLHKGLTDVEVYLGSPAALTQDN